jgi:uncharacterized membrane protein YccC
MFKDKLRKAMAKRAAIADTGVMKMRAKQDAKRKAAQDKLETELINKIVEQEYYNSRPKELSEKKKRAAVAAAEHKAMTDVEMYDYLTRNPELAEKLISEELALAARKQVVTSAPVASKPDRASERNAILDIIRSSDIASITSKDGKEYLKKLGITGFANKNVAEVRERLQQIQNDLNAAGAASSVELSHFSKIFH